MKYAVIDKGTGEIVIDNFLLIGRKPYTVDKGFIKIFVGFLRDVVENKAIAGKAIRLLFYMMENMDYNSYTIQIVPKYAQEKLGISEATYNRWIHTLINEGIITKINAYTYRLNPYVAVKGTRKEALENEINNP